MSAGTPLPPSVSHPSRNTPEEDVANDARTDKDLELVPDKPPEGVVARPKARRGFAVIDRKRLSEIASKGGKAAHAAGKAHQFTGEEARIAGRKGGHRTHAKRRERAEREQRESDASRGRKDP